MYQMQKDFKRGSIIIGSSMIWGCQYDQVMKFVDGKPDGLGKIFSVTTVNEDRHTNRKADLVANIYGLESTTTEWTLEGKIINETNYKFQGRSSRGTWDGADDWRLCIRSPSDTA